MNAYGQALIAARKAHPVALKGNDTSWWCPTCQKGSPSRLVPPSRPQVVAAAQRHIEAEARKIQQQGGPMNALDTSRHFVVIPVDPHHGIGGLRGAWAEAKRLSGLTPAELGNMRLVRGPVWVALWAWVG